MTSHTVQEILTPRPQSLRLFVLRLNSVVTKSLKGRDIIYGRPLYFYFPTINNICISNFFLFASFLRLTDKSFVFAANLMMVFFLRQRYFLQIMS